jgi:hypothetical protein
MFNDINDEKQGAHIAQCVLYAHSLFYPPGLLVLFSSRISL